MALTGGYLGLFVAAFLAATILPAQSELGLAALHLSGQFSLPLLVLVASVGNTLGGIVNWFIGRGIEHFKRRKWFPASQAQLESARRWYAKYGWWSLLLSWAPIIGDPITLVAGLLREPLWRFVLVVGFAKTARYTILALLIA